MSTQKRAPKKVEKEPVDDGWPKRVAPFSWVDPYGAVHHDLGEALAATEQWRNSS